jgi:hypothetical protein
MKLIHHRYRCLGNRARVKIDNLAKVEAVLTARTRRSLKSAVLASAQGPGVLSRVPLR